MTWAPCPHGVRTRGKDLQLSTAPPRSLSDNLDTALNECVTDFRAKGKGLWGNFVISTTRHPDCLDFPYFDSTATISNHPPVSRKATIASYVDCGKVCSVRCGLSRYKYPSTIWLAWSSLHAKWHTREHLIAPCPRTAFYMQDGIYKSHQMHQIWTRVVFMIVGTF